MRILLLGAGGFVGRHILAELAGAGHDVVAVVRRTRGLDGAWPDVRFVERDLARMTDAADWAPLLAGIDTVVNAAGILRGRTMDAIHVAMPVALAAAARSEGVRRIVLISAISARADVPTDYARSKLAGEAAVRDSGVDWTILRPSLVYAAGSYGGTSLLRGLAALPWRVPVPGRGDFAFTPIHAADLARAVRPVCEQPEHAGRTLSPVGPDTLTLVDLLDRYRRWLGFGRVRPLRVPMPLMRGIARVGDRIGAGPVATNSLMQLVAGNAGDPDAFARAIGFRPRSLDSMLAAHPAQVQDRWHARLFFLAPAIRAVLVLLWLASAALGLCFAGDRTAQFAHTLGIAPALGEALRVGTAGLDLAIAALVAFDRGARRSTIVQLVAILGYTVVLGIVLPGLWLDPLGPLLKNLPILALVLVHAAIAEQR